MPASTVIATIVAALVVTSGSLAAQDWQQTLAETPVYSIAVNPLQPRTVYAGGVSRTAYRSDDGGITWESVAVGATGGDSYLSLLYVHPRDTATVFIGGQFFGGLARSTDGGTSWATVLQDPTGRRIEFFGDAITAHPAAPDTMYAVRSTPPIVYRSTDAGASWDSLAIVPTTRTSDRFRTITVVPDSTHILIVGGRQGYYYRSTDGGRTFVEQPTPLSPHRDADLAMIRWSPTTPGTAYATMQKGGSVFTAQAGLYRSTDYGTTWSSIAMLDTSLYALAVQPTPQGTDEILVGGNIDLTTSQDVVGDSVVRRSTDGGTTWTAMADVPWTPNGFGIVTGNVWGIAFVPHPTGHTALLATESGIYRTGAVTFVDDGGQDPVRRSVVRRGASFELTVPTVPSAGPASYDVVLVDALGRRRSLPMTVVASTDRTTLRFDATSLSPGVYGLQVFDGARRHTSMFLW